MSFSNGSAGSSASQTLSAEELLRLVEAGADWIWETNNELRFSWLSGNYRDVTGIAPEDVLGRLRFDLMEEVSKSSPSTEAHLADIEARRPFRDFVYELKGGKRECRWVSISGYPRFDRDGNFIGYRGIGHNVTSVKVGHDVIKNSSAGGPHAERMMAALKMMNDAFAYYDSHGRLVLYNEAVLDIYRGLADVIRPGVSYEELHDTGVARGLWEMGDPDQAEWHRRPSQKQRNATIKTSDGRWIMHREMRTEDGSTIRISIDITEFEEQHREAAANETATQVVSDLKRTFNSLETRHQLARRSATAPGDGSLHLIGSSTDITELKPREPEGEQDADWEQRPAQGPGKNSSAPRLDAGSHCETATYPTKISGSPHGQERKVKSDNDLQAIADTLLMMAKPDMKPKQLLKAARKKHPKAAKKDVVRAAFVALISHSTSHPELSETLHDVAPSERTPVAAGQA